MASNVTEEASFDNKEMLLSKLYAIASEETSCPQKTVRALPVVIQTLATGVDIQDTKLKVCLELLDLSVEKVLSLLIYSQDWSAVEAVVHALFSCNVMCDKILSDFLVKPEGKVMKEMTKFCEILNLNHLDRSLLWAVHHALQTGSFTVLDILLRLTENSYEKRNFTSGDKSNTLLHVVCSDGKDSSLPVWLLGWGLDPTIINADGKLPADLLPGDSPVQKAFQLLAANLWMKDLAYMNRDEVKMFLLQQLCAAGQSLDLETFSECLQHNTECDFSEVFAALKLRRRNTAWKILLDTVGVNSKGLKIFKDALCATDQFNKKTLLVDVTDSVVRRLKYEHLARPYTGIEWLQEFMPSTQNPAVDQKELSVTELLQNSYWYKTKLSTRHSNTTKPKEVKCPSQRPDKLPTIVSFVEEICDSVQTNQNSAIYLPCSDSHYDIAAHIFTKHFAQNAQLQTAKETSCQEKPVKADTKTPDVQDAQRVKTLGSKGEKGPDFYKQQRQRRSKQRQRQNSASENPSEAAKLEYRKKHRRRTKSSSEYLENLVEDISNVDFASDDELSSKVQRTFVAKKGALLVVPSGKLVPPAVVKLRTLASHLKAVEHAGSGKPKAGLRKLLNASDIVVTHFAAFKNSIRAKSFDMREASLVVLADFCYSDEVLDFIPNKSDGNAPLIVSFTEFPNRDSLCSLESVLRYVLSKMKVDGVHSVTRHTGDLMKVVYPDVAYNAEVLLEEEPTHVVRILRGFLSTAFGTYGQVKGCIYVIGRKFSAEEFLESLTQEFTKVLPSSLKVFPCEVPSSRRIREDLYCVSSGPEYDTDMKSQSAKLNFVAFVTQLETINVETVHARTISQCCVDYLRCQQYISLLKTELNDSKLT